MVGPHVRRSPRRSTEGLAYSSSFGTSGMLGTLNGPVARNRRQTVGTIEETEQYTDSRERPLLSVRQLSFRSSRIPTPMGSRVSSSATNATTRFSPDSTFITARSRQYRPSNRLSLNYPADPARTPSAQRTKVETLGSPRQLIDFTPSADEGENSSEQENRIGPSRSTSLAGGLSAISDGCGETKTQDADADEAIHTPTSRTDPITDSMPVAWWIGRFSSLSDRFRTEELDIKNATAIHKGVSNPGAGMDLSDKRHPANRGMFDNNARHHVVFVRLRELCATGDAAKSFDDFRKKYEAKEGRVQITVPRIARKAIGGQRDATTEDCFASQRAKDIGPARRRGSVHETPVVTFPLSLDESSYTLQPPKKLLGALPSFGSSARLSLGNIGRRLHDKVPDNISEQLTRQVPDTRVEAAVGKRASMFERLARRKSKVKEWSKEVEK